MHILDGSSASISCPPLRRTCLLIICAALLSACGGSKLSAMLAAPTMAQITFKADARLNVDSRGRSTPVVVRYYFLKNASAFNSADFFSLYEKDQQTLGEALLQREEIVLQAGETKVLQPKDAGDAQVFAVMAAFRDIEHSTWRATAPLAATKVTAIAISLKNNQLDVLHAAP